MTQRQIGFFQIILAGVFFGFLGIFGKVAYQNNILPGELLGLRFLSASILLGAVLLILKKPPYKMKFKNILSSLLLGVLGYAVFSSCYFFALQGISASLTVLLLYMYPAMVTVGAQLFFKEKINKTGWLALVISSVGLVFLVWGEWSVSKPVYLVYGFCSAFFYAVYILVSRKTLKNVDPMQSSFFVQLGAGIALCLFNFSEIQRPIAILENYFLLIIGMAIVCSVFPLTLFLAGLQKVTSSEASLLSTTEPIFGVLIASLFLNETMLPVQLAGGLMVIFGLVLTSFKK